MSEPVAYLNGQYVPVSKASLHVFDLGVVGGVAVTEMVRTFAFKPFRLKEHLHRLSRSITAVGLQCELTTQEFESIALKLVDKNKKLLSANQDLGIVFFVTAGPNATYVGPEVERHCTVGVHTFPLPFSLWAERYKTGQHLVTPSVRSIPADVINPQVKFRSRLHWYLADQEARRTNPDAVALLLDHDGFVTETSAGNLCIVVGHEILSPPTNTTLPGVSLAVVRELALQSRISFRQCRISPSLVMRAQEAFITSTPTCLQPVASLNGENIGPQAPGPITLKFQELWSQMVGVDFVAQMLPKPKATKKASKKASTKSKSK